MLAEETMKFSLGELFHLNVTLKPEFSEGLHPSPAVWNNCNRVKESEVGPTRYELRGCKLFSGNARKFFKLALSTCSLFTLGVE